MGSQSTTPSASSSIDSDTCMTPTPITPIPVMPSSINSQLFEARGFRPIFLPLVPTIPSSMTYLQNFNNLPQQQNDIGQMETDNN